MVMAVVLLATYSAAFTCFSVLHVVALLFVCHVHQDL